jgi:hypothetical protein
MTKSYQRDPHHQHEYNDKDNSSYEHEDDSDNDSEPFNGTPSGRSNQSNHSMPFTKHEKVAIRSTQISTMATSFGWEERRERRRESNRLSKRRCRSQRRELMATCQKELERLSEEYKELSKEKEQLQKELIDSLLEQQDATNHEGSFSANGKEERSLDAIGTNLLHTAVAIALAEGNLQHHKKDTTQDAGKLPFSSQQALLLGAATTPSSGRLKRDDGDSLSLSGTTTACAFLPSMLNQGQGVAADVASPPRLLANSNLHLALGAANYSLLTAAGAAGNHSIDRGASFLPGDAMPPESMAAGILPSATTSTGPMDPLLLLRRMINAGAASSMPVAAPLPLTIKNENDNSLLLQYLSATPSTSHHQRASNEWTPPPDYNRDFASPSLLPSMVAAASAIPSVHHHSNNGDNSHLLHLLLQQQQERELLLALLSCPPPSDRS